MIKKYFILIPIIVLLQSCALVDVQKKYYKNDPGDPIQKQEMDFEHKQALAKGATINSKAVNDIYFNGTEPKSKEAEIALEFSYEVMGIFGVNTDFDINDIESIKKSQIETREAVKEKDRIIAKLEEDVKAKELEKNKIIRDKEAEFEANNNKWKTSMGSMFWGWFWTIILILITAIILQAWSGIPIFTWIFKGGISAISALKNGFKQTVSAVDDTLKELKETTQDPTVSQAERDEATYWYNKMKENLRAKQDEMVKNEIKKIKQTLQ